MGENLKNKEAEYQLRQGAKQALKDELDENDIAGSSYLDDVEPSSHHQRQMPPPDTLWSDQLQQALYALNTWINRSQCFEPPSKYSIL